MSASTPGLRDMQLALEAAPFHRWLGLKVISADEEAIRLEMPWRDEIVSNPRTQSAHGGILAALIDLTGFYALLAAGSVPVATADLRVDYHKPATPGRLTITGRIVRLGSTLSVAEASITNADGDLLSSGRGAYQMPRRSQ
ncbi:MAG: PaaI family thioesterase [Pseudomonadota bacterium]|nr:PaaI family thioesterase [Hyphomonas sp. Mor2]MCR9195081.1 PaaI family thioesterase [Hyphomonas sp.]